MNFINNYSEPLTLALGATSATLTLPDGEYRLTLTDSESTRWEVVGAVVVSGSATLQRALEGSADQSWPEGSVIYSAITAGLLQTIFQRLLPAGGTESQVLSKLSDSDFAVQWVNAPGVPSFSGALSGRLFVAYLDPEDSVYKAAIINLVTGAVEQPASWMQAYPNSLLSQANYCDSLSALAAFPTQGSGATLQIFEGSGFTPGATISDIGLSGGVSWKPDGSKLVAVRGGDSVIPINYTTSPTASLQKALGGTGEISGAAPEAMPIWSPDGAYLYIPGDYGIKRHNGTTFAIIDTVLDEWIFQFALSADGSNAAVLSYSSNTYEESIRIVETTGWTVLATFSSYSYETYSGKLTKRMTFNPANSQQLAVAMQETIGGLDVACVILDVSSPGTEVALSPEEDYGTPSGAGKQAAFSPQGDRLYISTSSGLHSYVTADWSYAGTLPNISAENVLALP